MGVESDEEEVVILATLVLPPSFLFSRIAAGGISSSFFSCVRERF